MIKKIVSLATLACILLVPGLVCHAENSFKLQYEENIYSIKQASSPECPIPFSVTEEDGTILLSHKGSGITAEANLTVMQKSTFEALRNYYNDFEASDEAMFRNFVNINESYIDAALESYKMNFLYGSGGKPGSEHNMKLFAKTSQILYGHNSDVYVYNTLDTADKGYSEITHIDIFVPAYSSFSILNVNFSMKSGTLNTKSMDIINTMLKSIHVNGFPQQEEALATFENNTLVASINSGIYPSSLKSVAPYYILHEPDSGFRLKYPVSLVPYMQSNITDTLYYNSFKVSPHEEFSIIVEPAVLPEVTVDDKAEAIKEKSSGEIDIIAEGSSSFAGGNSVFIDYFIKHEGSISYIEEYSAINNGKLYTLKFESRKGLPSELAITVFSMIFNSFEFISGQPQENTAAYENMLKYFDENSGLSFAFPSNWILAVPPVTIASAAPFTLSDACKSYNCMRLYLPEISDFLNIYISEGRLDSKAETAEAISGSEASALLAHSITQKGNATYIYKLANYLDSGSKGRLLSRIDILCGEKIYSMIINVNSSWVEEGRISDPKIASIINTIASSFTNLYF